MDGCVIGGVLELVLTHWLAYKPPCTNCLEGELQNDASQYQCPYVRTGSQNGCHQCLSLREVQVASCLSQKLSKISSWVCPRLLSKHVRFLCAPFKSRISVICSPPVLLYASPIGLPRQTFLGLVFQCSNPRLGSLIWSLDSLLLGELLQL